MSRSTAVGALLVFALVALAACGPSKQEPNGDCDDPNNLLIDPLNCGTCGHVCSASQSCTGGECVIQTCNPGESRECYGGAGGTKGVGPCVGGTQTCSAQGVYGDCVGEVVPRGEICANGTDDNCNGSTDEDADTDGDGVTTCAGDCCDTVVDGCGDPQLVGPGAFEAPGNMVDDDCDGTADNVLPACDTGLASNSADPMDFARAIDLCQTATAGDQKWGVISASWTLTNGSGTPDPSGHSIRDAFGSGATPKLGVSLGEISTGVAADANDANPAPDLTQSYPHSPGESAPFPSDWYGANGSALPNSPGCPEPLGDDANDPVMLTLTIRVPTNAKSFSLNTNFYSYEFPEYTCSPYNDFFVVLLDSTFAGSPANPTDKNLAFYSDANMMSYPVGVNLAYGDTGLFTQCVNGATGCAGLGLSFPMGTISTCSGVDLLGGTGFDAPEAENCDANSLAGGATGWLTTAGNVVGGETITLRIAIWDTSDSALDSTAIIDNFQWSVDASDPGTVIVD
jgi:hypothetical protein